MRSWEATAAIAAAKVVAILRCDGPERAVAVGEEIVRAGLPVVEVSLTTPDALTAIRELTRTDGLIGAGTVLDAASARAAILAGARFLVSPAVIPEVISTGNRYGVPVLPGAQTPTEIVRALELGAALVKLFPADHLGPGFLRGVAAAIPQAAFVPTGGISAANAREWLAAGAVALGVGGALTGDTPGRAAEALREAVAA
ncbi:bifunctional 4-hydroxy-2-oxoglutarate aldolase/2-dehydro-3-deoxy-phosphogluconate aldolase [Actinokineospora soli]|uniref:Bifunctional 4-hydroxy-2-oxoglutarate aldolase/2-dehydro-3-deoxy-phosphogluconate aldolase n=1 Tax=Actinokineospora soli TaxID=1048753 RepID=A0ABW2TRC8_9PSEU